MFQNTRSSPGIGKGATAWLIAISMAATASAQWTATVLHPTQFAEGTFAVGVDGSSQVGYSGIFGNAALLWSGTAESVVSLNPPGASSAAAVRVSGGQQVGAVNFGVRPHAGYWSGTADSWVDLHPAGYLQSSGHGIGGGQQVGIVQVGAAPGGGAIYHASLWTGTAASWVDLNPPLQYASWANDTDGVTQVGYVNVFGPAGIAREHASLWHGSAASWVDLHPTQPFGWWDTSQARSVFGDQQAGYINGHGTIHAALWSGTAASMVDLHPPSTLQSSVNDLYGAFQVGSTFTEFPGPGRRAAFWSGSAASWVDLGAFVPFGYSSSEALGVWSDSISIYVVGYASHNGVAEAILWTRPVPSPASSILLAIGGISMRRRRAAPTIWRATDAASGSVLPSKRGRVNDGP